MKVQITIDEPNMDGYFYACPKNVLFNGDYGSLGSHFYPGQCSEIYAPSILDYLEYFKIEEIINSWFNLLKIGGKLTVGGIDSFLLTKKYISRNINQDELNAIYFNSSPTLKSFNSIQDIKNILLNFNMSIKTIDIDREHSKFVIEATK